MTIDDKYTTKKTRQEQIKLDNERANFIVKCKCGHSITMVDTDRTICTHCGHWIYRTPGLEFKYKLKEKMI